MHQRRGAAAPLRKPNQNGPSRPRGCVHACVGMPSVRQVRPWLPASLPSLSACPPGSLILPHLRASVRALGHTPGTQTTRPARRSCRRFDRPGLSRSAPPASRSPSPPIPPQPCGARPQLA